jgi:hypothetical protein
MKKFIRRRHAVPMSPQNLKKNAGPLLLNLELS